MQKFTFDGPNKLFHVKQGYTEIDVKVDLYSDWKEELFLSDNLKWTQALSVIGGEPVTPTQYIGTTVFLINGWKIVPPSGDTTVEFINGNIYTDDQTSPFADPSGYAFHAHFILERSNIRDEVDITSSAEFVSELRSTRFTAQGESGSGVRWDDMHLFLLAMACGKIEEISDGVYKFFAQDETTHLFTLTKSDITNTREVTSWGSGLPQ